MPGRILRRAHAAVALAVIVFFMHQPAVLGEEVGRSTWTAVATSGGAFYKPADGPAWADWQPLVAGTQIAVSGQVKTGPNGEVTLVRGKDTIELSPQTVIEIAPSPSSLTRVIQKIGKAFFNVDSIPGRSFKVETPRLVAGVLGTQFVVITTPQGTSVSVDEGRVEVAHLNGTGNSVEIGPGQTASLNGSGQLVVAGTADAQNKGGRGKGDRGNNGNRGGNSGRADFAAGGNHGAGNNGGDNNGGGANGGNNGGGADGGGANGDNNGSGKKGGKGAGKRP